MHGFRISIGKPFTWPLQADEQHFLRRIDEGDFHLTQWSLRKFEEDKLWLDTPDCFLATEGVLFNRETVKADLSCNSISQWRGSFAGVRYDKKTHECMVFNDQIGSHMLFWCQTAEAVWVSSDIFELSQACGLKMPNVAYMQAILDNGYAHDDSTMIAGIRRICAGECLHIQSCQVCKTQYYRFDNRPLHPLNEETLAETNRLFRQAVERIVRKNEEYGLRQFYPLSGGLDSRMVQIIAHQLTKEPITNFTYSQSGHYDHLLPEKIASYLGNQWTFLPLDGGNYLTQIDAITHATQALINYNGPAESYYCSTQFDWRDVGVIATGVNGDNIFSVETDTKHEISRLYSLSFAGNGLGSPLVLQQYTETYSPFCDVDVLDYVLHIPLRERWNYRMYDQWIIRYYPEAAQWDHKGEQIGHRRIILPVMGRNIPLRDLAKRVLLSTLKRLHLYDGYRNREGSSMNPYDTWMKTNPALRDALMLYYTDHKELLHLYPGIARRAEQIMQESAFYQQCAVLTILSAIRQLA